MAGYTELIKNFSVIRDYMREFYIYGYKSRDDFKTEISGSSYDNGKRRLSSWLKGYIQTAYTSSRKRIQYISVDSREIIHNPLYNAFKAKIFTGNDIRFYFFLMDMLSGKDHLSVNEIITGMHEDYINQLTKHNFKADDKWTMGVRTVEMRLNEFTEMGILIKDSESYQCTRYSMAKDPVNMRSWYDAIEFFSETNPVGVIGSYLLDREVFKNETPVFWYKHHYMLYAMESEILEVLLKGMTEKKYVEITWADKKGKEIKNVVYRMKLYVSTQNGREYLVCRKKNRTGIIFIRIDSICTAATEKDCELTQQYEQEYQTYKPYLWGTVSGNPQKIEHVEMILHVYENETYILERLEREKRNGQICKIDEEHYKYTVDTFNAMELMPWIRTFTGRIDRLESSDTELEKKYQEDMERLYQMYFGGEDDDFS